NQQIHDAPGIAQPGTTSNVLASGTVPSGSKPATQPSVPANISVPGTALLVVATTAGCLVLVRTTAPIGPPHRSTYPYRLLTVCNVRRRSLLGYNPLAFGSFSLFPAVSSIHPATGDSPSQPGTFA